MDLQDHGPDSVRQYDLGAVQISKNRTKMAGQASTRRRPTHIAVICDIENQLGPLQKHARTNIRSSEPTTASGLEGSEKPSHVVGTNSISSGIRPANRRNR